MNRTERLYAIAEELRRAGPKGRTGAQLAALLEVHQRTIKRDVTALQEAGSPIRAQHGPGGGYALLGSASLPPVNFTAGQAVAVAIALAALPPGSPFGTAGAVARNKLFDVLGPADRERAAHLSSRVWVDRPDRAERPAQPAVLRAVEESLGQQLVLNLHYRSGAGETTTRSVEPVVLAHTLGRWYVVAWCRRRGAVRWFRLDRVERADVTRKTYEPRPVEEIGTPPETAAPVAPE